MSGRCEVEGCTNRAHSSRYCLKHDDLRAREREAQRQAAAAAREEC